MDIIGDLGLFNGRERRVFGFRDTIELGALGLLCTSKITDLQNARRDLANAWEFANAHGEDDLRKGALLSMAIVEREMGIVAGVAEQLLAYQIQARYGIVPEALPPADA